MKSQMPRTLLTLAALATCLVVLTGCCSLFPSLCKPIIIQQPESQVALIGSPVIFTVVAQHPPPNTNAPLTYQWRRDGVDIPGATSSSYIILSVANSDLA